MMNIRIWGATLAAAASVALVAAPAQAQHFSDGYSFLQAIKKGDGAKATELLSQPGSTVINARDPSSGDSALHMVVRERQLAWLSFLLGKRANPNLQNAQGDTPLGLAAQLGWVEGAELLLSMRARVDEANSSGETPLIFAVHKRDLPMVRLLLGAGANPKRSDSVAGYSALDYARQDARSAAIAKLLEEGPGEKKKEVAGPIL